LSEIDQKLIEHLASLIRIDLNSEESELFAGQLNGLVEEFKNLQLVDTDGVEPTGHIGDLVTIMRTDESSASLDQEEVLMNAPDRNGMFIKVKRVIE
jgi:aspartyl-tRNA(Asn)/glutamyl-tRNA(Gln) amidotransferase subunit C